MKQMCSRESSICHRHCRVTLCTHPRSWWCVVELNDDGCRRRLLYSSSLCTPTHHGIVRAMVEHRSCGAEWEVLRALRHPAHSRGVRTWIWSDYYCSGTRTFSNSKENSETPGRQPEIRGRQSLVRGSQSMLFARPPILPPNPSRNRHLWKK